MTFTDWKKAVLADLKKTSYVKASLKWGISKGSLQNLETKSGERTFNRWVRAQKAEYEKA